jgi:hypothetical protein
VPFLTVNSTQYLEIPVAARKRILLSVKSLFALTEARDQGENIEITFIIVPATTCSE